MQVESSCLIYQPIHQLISQPPQYDQDQAIGILLALSDLHLNALYQEQQDPQEPSEAMQLHCR